MTLINKDALLAALKQAVEDENYLEARTYNKIYAIVEAAQSALPEAAPFEVLASYDLFPASELEIQVCRLSSGEEVIRFEDCTGKPPIIYGWCFRLAVLWLSKRGEPQPREGEK